MGLAVFARVLRWQGFVHGCIRRDICSASRLVARWHQLFTCYHTRIIVVRWRSCASRATPPMKLVPAGWRTFNSRKKNNGSREQRQDDRSNPNRRPDMVSHRKSFSPSAVPCSQSSLPPSSPHSLAGSGAPAPFSRARSTTSSSRTSTCTLRLQADGGANFPNGSSPVSIS